MPEDVTLGVLSPMLGGFYFGGILNGIELASRHIGARVVAVQTFDPGLPDTAYQETSEFRLPVAWGQVSGFVIILNAVGGEYLAAIRKAEIPSVTISQAYPDLDSPAILSDNRHGVRKAVQHLIDHGHRDIAFAGHVAQPDIQERYRTYYDALQGRGLTPRLYPVGDNLFAGGRDAGEAMLAAGLPSTAVIAATDFNAIGIMDVLTEAGTRVPHDLAVVGFDDTAEASLARPSLTTVRQDFGELGRRAVKQLVARIEGRRTPNLVHVPTSLVRRESCGCPPEISSPRGVGRRDSVASRSHVRELIRDNVLFKELFNAQYEVSMDLLLSHIDDPRGLNWLRGTTTQAGLLGLWSGTGDSYGAPPRLELAGRFDRQRPNPALMTTAIEPVPVDRFPPPEFIDLAAQRPGDVVSVVPVKMRASDWGVLATVGPVEDRLSVGRATINQWAALLSVALDRDAALNALRLQEESLRRAALYDSLTGLPNRVLFADRVRDAINAAQRERQRRFAVLFLDLDDFKIINDSLGHLVGDQLLVQVAERIAGNVRLGDMAARLGGDEFAVLVDHIEGQQTAEAVTQRIQATFADPFHIDGQDVVVSASIGIAQSIDRYLRAEEVLRDADIAMYRAKAQAKGSHAHFDVEMRSLAVRRLQNEADLRRAVERDEFVLFYQPVVELANGRIVACEALIRWQHPTRGLLRPHDFIEIAEEVGLTAPIGRWTLSNVCDQLREWIDAGHVNDDFRVKVNISHKQFWHTDLRSDVLARLAATKLPADRLTLEITESVIMQRADAARLILRQLHDAGLGLDIDDFGTGYSSLSALLQLPIDALKIDQSFVSQLVTDQRSRELVRSIVRMGRNLGLYVIAEGVETSAQRAHLVQLGCQYGQGFLFAKPMPAKQATALLTAAKECVDSEVKWPNGSGVGMDKPS